MLRIADTPLESFIPYFTNNSLPVAFLVPTPTGYDKSIMDATFSVRALLKNANIHNYETQGQGQANKHLIDGFFVNVDSLDKTVVSLYRPITKKGDPRIWFSNLKKYCKPCNLLAIFSIGERLFIANLSNAEIADSLKLKGFFYDLLQQAYHQSEAIAAELLSKIRDIHRRGFLPTITSGDPGVGDTLEYALGIFRNNAPKPDYKGIELKASRSKLRSPNRNTLFTQVPNWHAPGGMNERQILENFGYWSKDKNGIPRFQLYCTLSAKHINSQGLFLSVEGDSSNLSVRHKTENKNSFVTLWEMDRLRERLIEKHPATFWVKASSQFVEGKEYFRYDHIKYTRNPNLQIFADLLDTGIITVDFLMHLRKNGNIRDHGFPFKISPENLEMLFPKPIEYDLMQ